jgi:hypothetical protein
MSRIALLVGIARTVPHLGLRNVLRVAAYRAKLAAGWRPRPIAGSCPAGPLFGGAAADCPTYGAADLLLFGWFSHRVEGVPDWHASPLDPCDRMDPALDWTEALRALNGRDAKQFWELSRFFWVPQLALAARDGNVAARARLNAWLIDWINQNPPHQGINWACGQEAAIRLMNLALAALILECWDTPSPALAWLVEAHARRIRPTLAYALGQDNNHGAAEACALFIAGSWGTRWSMTGASSIASLGHRWLQDRALRLVQADGSPCQYSTNYHRAVLETFCLAELWSRRTDAAALSAQCQQRIAEGARWLHRVTDLCTGDAPNLGANDGSHLFNVPPTAYRDFRPTIALTARLFDLAEAYPEPDARVTMLDLPAASRAWLAPTSATDDVGGYHTLRSGRAFALMRYPRFRFRPSQADALHLDLWVDGLNLLRDSGSYSYVAREGAVFDGTGAHNTVEFDGHDQMPRLSRFLYGEWLQARAVQPVKDSPDGCTAAAGYCDKQGAEHHRHIAMSARLLVCTDRLGGRFGTARLRWRLAPGDYMLEGTMLTGEGLSIVVRSDGPRLKARLIEGVESRLYLQKSSLPVLEIVIDGPGIIISDIRY